MDNILKIASLVVLGCGAVIQFKPEIRKYGILLYALGFVLFGVSDVFSSHDAAYGAGMFAIAAILVARFVVDRAKRK